MFFIYLQQKQKSSKNKCMVLISVENSPVGVLQGLAELRVSKKTGGVQDIGLLFKALLTD